MAGQMLDEPQFEATIHPARRATSQPEDAPRRYRAKADEPFLRATDMLEVTNDDTKAHVLAWNRRKYRIEAGGTAFVPFPAIVMALGDPRSRQDEVIRFDDGEGDRGLIPPRYDELRRLFARYAVRNENIDDESDHAHMVASGEKEPPIPSQIPVSLVGKAPKMSVRTMSGTVIPFPIHLPDMVPYPVMQIEGPAGPVTDARQSVDRLMSENADLRDRLANIEQALDLRLGATDGAGQP